MENATVELTQSYIDKYYITRSKLSRLANISEERIVELIEAKCIPPHAYEARASVAYVSTFGTYALRSSPHFYYHPGLVKWIEKAELLAKKCSLPEVAKSVKTCFWQDLNTALDGRPLPWPDGIDFVWDYLMDGTWSLCLKDLNVTDLVQKEIARAHISKIVATAKDRPIDDKERQELEYAVGQYDQVVLPFSPHELPESSRCLEIGSVIRKYKLGNGSRHKQGLRCQLRN